MTRQVATNRGRYRFGQFLLDPDARVLSRADDLLTLSPKVFDCIVYLIENRDRAIGHGELSAAIWGRADILDIQLRQLIRKVRRTVGDDGGRQLVIRTVPHFGFHWIAVVDLEDVPPLRLPSSETGSAGRTRAQRGESRTPLLQRAYLRIGWRAVAWSGLALITVLAISADDHALRSFAASKPTAEDVVGASLRDAIGVLPVEVGGSTDPDLAWMRLGLMDLIATYLRSAKVSVAPSSEIVALDRRGVDLGALAQRVRAAAGVRNLVQPSVTRFGDHWKVRLDLKDDQGESRTFEAQAPDVIVAARAASDRLLAMQGKSAASELGSPTLAQLSQRVEAAMLVDNFSTARNYIASAPPALRETPELQLAMARIEIATHRLDEADARLAPLLDAVSLKDNPALRARILTQAGIAQLNQRDASVRRLSEAIGILEDLDEPIHLSFACVVRGYVYTSMRRFDEARADYACARTASALADDELGVARVDNNEAALEILRGRPSDALPFLDSAAHIFERFGALDKMADPLLNRISANLELLQPVEALGAYRQAAAKLANVDDAEMQRMLRTLGAESLAANGRLHEALALLDDILNTADPNRESDTIVASLRLRSQLELWIGREDSAIAFAKRSIDAVKALGHGSSESAAASLVLVRALRNKHQVAEASAQTQRISTWARGESGTATSLRVKIAEAEEAWSARRWQVATQDYEEALRIASNEGTPANLVEVVESYGTALLNGGDVARASIVVGRTRHWANRDFSSALLQVRLYQALGQAEAWRASLDTARQLAGERSIPADLERPPRQAVKLADRR